MKANQGTKSSAAATSPDFRKTQNQQVVAARGGSIPGGGNLAETGRSANNSMNGLVLLRCA